MCIDFNSIMVRHNTYCGLTERQAYIYKGYRRGWEQFVTGHGDYLCGYKKPNYPVPANISRVSLGEDYQGIFYIDNGDTDNPEMVWAFDTMPELNKPWFLRV